MDGDSQQRASLFDELCALFFPLHHSSQLFLIIALFSSLAVFSCLRRRILHRGRSQLEKGTGGMTWGHPNVKNDADLEEGTGGMTCGHPNVKSDADLQNLEPDPYLPGYLYGFDTAEKWQQLQQMPSISAQSAWRAEQYHKEFPLQFEDRLQLESIYCDLQHFQGKNTELQQNGIRSCNIQEAQCRHRGGRGGGEQHWPRGRHCFSSENLPVEGNKSGVCWA
ncbi:uncharacterized protein LOC110032410 [Phalaenopsis equestris]|uniref:uncharacterized protein LOC110032410 n=1 Tax=Phalaenopsis equestris TaxID=78828 RepID=UPI0009E3E4AF|nr:uncharacterized protein LOC110032410 [Phalaenopsis equestris]